MNSSKMAARTQGRNVAVFAVAAALAVNAGFGYALSSAGTKGQRYLVQNDRTVNCSVAYLGTLPTVHVYGTRTREPMT